MKETEKPKNKKSKTKDLNKLSIEFWLKIRNTIKEKQYKPLLKECIKNIKEKNNIFLKNYYNIYYYLVLENCENITLIKKCFLELIELQNNNPNDILIKYNLLNYYFYFQKNEKVKKFLNEVKENFGEVNCVEFGELVIKEKINLNFDKKKIFLEFIKKFPNYEKGYIKTIFCLIKENYFEEARKILVEFLNHFEIFDFETKINILSFNQILKIDNNKILNIERELECNFNKNSKNKNLYQILYFNNSMKKINSKKKLDEKKILEIILVLKNIFYNTKNENLKYLSILNILDICEENNFKNKNLHYLKIFINVYNKNKNINYYKKKFDILNKEIDDYNKDSDLSEYENTSKTSISNLEMDFFESDNELDTVDFDLEEKSKFELESGIGIKSGNLVNMKMVQKKKEEDDNEIYIDYINNYYENLVDYVLYDLKKKFCHNLEKIRNSFSMSICKLGNGNLSDRKNTFENLEKEFLKNKKKQNPENLELLLQMAYLDLKENDTNSFKKKLLIIYNKNPEFRKNLVTFSLANLFYMEKNYETSLFFFSKNYKISEDNKITSLLYIGKIFDKMNKKKNSMITYQKLNTTFPNQIFGFYRIGKNLFFEKKYLEAKKFFKIVIDKDEYNFKSKTYLGIIGILLGTSIPEEVKQILFYFSTALENPEINVKFEFLIKYHFSIFYEKIENYDMAIKYKEQAISYKQNDINLVNELVKLYIKKNLLKKAIKLYKKFIKYDKNNLYVVSQLGCLYAYFLNFKKSEKYFLYIKKKDKKNFKANMTLGKIYRDKLESPEMALNCFFVIKDLEDINNYEIYYEIGLTYFFMNQFEEGVSFFEKSLPYEKSFIVLGDYYFDKKIYFKSLNYYQACFKINNKSISAIKGILESNLKLKKNETNFKFFSLLNIKKIKNSEIFILMTKSLYTIDSKNYVQNKVQAENFLKLALKFSKDDPKILQEISKLFYDFKLYKKGVETLSKLIGQIKTVDFFFNIAFGNYKINNYNNSFKYLRFCLNLEPTNPKFLFFMAQVYIKNQYFERAIEILLKLNKSFPTVMKIVNLLGDVYKRLGNKEKAGFYYEKLRRNKNIGKVLVNLKKKKEVI